MIAQIRCFGALSKTNKNRWLFWMYHFSKESEKKKCLKGVNLLECNADGNTSSKPKRFQFALVHWSLLSRSTVQYCHLYSTATCTVLPPIQYHQYTTPTCIVYSTPTFTGQYHQYTAQCEVLPPVQYNTTSLLLPPIQCVVLPPVHYNTTSTLHSVQYSHL